MSLRELLQGQREALSQEGRQARCGNNGRVSIQTKEGNKEDRKEKFENSVEEVEGREKKGNQIILINI
jgi:hypothetical protein